MNNRSVITLLLNVTCISETEEERKPLSCDQCGKRYANIALFRIHTNTHLSEILSTVFPFNPIPFFST